MPPIEPENIVIDIHQLESFLRGVELLKGLPSLELLRIAQKCQLIQLKRGEPIFRKFQPGGFLYVVMSGRVKIYGSSTQGRAKTLAYLEPGDFFGEMSLLEDEARSASATALEDSVLICLKSEDYRKLVYSKPAASRALIKVLSERLKRANKEIEALSFNNVYGRIAMLLLDLAERYGVDSPDGRRIEIAFSHRELAEMAGTAREVISRVMSRFKRTQSIAVMDNKILITNAEKLKNWIF